MTQKDFRTTLEETEFQHGNKQLNLDPNATDASATRPITEELAEVLASARAADAKAAVAALQETAAKLRGDIGNSFA